MGNVKGSAVITRIAFTKEHFGEEGYQKVLASLSDEDRAFLEQQLVLPQAWVPLARYCRLVEAIDRIHGQGNLELAFKMGRFSAQRNLPTVYRLFFRVSSVRFVLDRAPRLYALHYDTGQLHLIEDSPGSVTVRIEGVDTPHCAHCVSVHGWAAQAVTLSGGHLLETRRTCRLRRSTACDLLLRWR